MRRTYFTNFILFVFTTVLLFSCQPSKKGVEKKIVTVSILPQKAFVEAIAGDIFTVNVMIPPGASPASYDPSAQQMVKYTNSSVYFMIGSLGYEQAWMERLKSSAPDVLQVKTEDVVTMLESQIECTHDDHSHYHGELDPHVWTSPMNVIDMVNEMCNVLSAIEPQHKQLFKDRTAEFVEKVTEIDQQISEHLKPFDGQTFLVFHPSLGYFAHDYGLIQESIEFEGKSPSASHMAKVVDLAKREKIKSIFIQKQFEIQKAEMIAKEIGADVVYIDPLSENWIQEISDISKKMTKAFN